ncbi:MAG: hypothetical protein GEV08_04665 [Acidimicrobiia bacterium]|nr:hypothetical protein [Acidimicrobiia bacterium]
MAGDAERDELMLRLHDRRCAIALLEADLDAALDGIAVHRQLASNVRSMQVFEERFPILAARVMLGARRRDEAEHWTRLAQRIEAPDIVSSVTVPTLRAWQEWLFGRLDLATKLIDAAVGWMDEHDIGAHHHAFDTLITAGWCRLGAGDLDDAARLAARARGDADTLGCGWNHLQAGHLSARLALVAGDPVGALRMVEDMRSRAVFDTCRPYADRILALEVEALAASGALADPASTIDALGPGPPSQLLRARFERPGRGDLEALLGDRATWPVADRLQGEVILAARGDRSSPSSELLALVDECAETGWVLPFLGFGTQTEHLLLSVQLEKRHPKLERALAHPASAVRACSPSGNGVRLTNRELTLLQLLPTHLSYGEMGERLYLSVNTVKSNLKMLYRKLGASTRRQAVEAGQRSGLL